MLISILLQLYDTKVVFQFLIGNCVPERNPGSLLITVLLSTTYNWCFSLALNLIIELVPASPDPERNRLYLKC
jgi:hypothetical protein